jgi:uncharacterized membrane protein
MRFSRLFLALFFILVGAMHFLKPEFYLRIMPPQIPFPLGMVYLSGAVEMLLGALVISQKTRRAAGWGLIALLIAVFPANIYLALHPEIFPGIPVWAYWARLPLQAVFIFWVWKVTLV